MAAQVLTEEQAVRKYCPLHLNNHAPNCIGSNCMKWEYEYAPKREGSVYESVKTGKGSCGL